jgi:hypothetical protein
MIPFDCSHYNISSNTKLTVIDIKELSKPLIQILDEHFVSICEGDSGADIRTVKKYVVKLFEEKQATWIMGATAEFFIHLYMKLLGFKQECLFLNLEEYSIKKGFDGYYSQNGTEWLMESKSGSINSQGISHAGKVQEAMQDLEDKVSGKSKKKKVNNPWRNAYSHASLYDVGAAEKIRKNIKALSDDFTCGRYHDIGEFNTIPCGTVFLSGVWNPPDHKRIYGNICELSNKLKGKSIHAICITQVSVDLFRQYIGEGTLDG